MWENEKDRVKPGARSRRAVAWQVTLPLTLDHLLSEHHKVETMPFSQLSCSEKYRVKAREHSHNVGPFTSQSPGRGFHFRF